jgi:hypothetical protein
MGPFVLDPHAIVAILRGCVPRLGPATAASLRILVRWASHHTGLPVVLVAAIGLVLSWRIIRRTMRLAVEVVIALLVLAAATRLGWLTW